MQQNPMRATGSNFSMQQLTIWFYTMLFFEDVVVFLSLNTVVQGRERYDLYLWSAYTPMFTWIYSGCTALRCYPRIPLRLPNAFPWMLTWEGKSSRRILSEIKQGLWKDSQI